MGIGALRRYHPTLDPALKAEAKQDVDPRVVAHQKAIEEASAAFDAARDASTAAATAAAEAPDNPDAQAAAEAAATAAQDAQTHLEAVQKAFEDFPANADAPSRGASKADWIAYAGTKGRDEASLVDADGKALGRDAIAEIFLGPKAQ